MYDTWCIKITKRTVTKGWFPGNPEMMTAPSYRHLSCFYCPEMVVVGRIEVLGPWQIRKHCMNYEARKTLVWQLLVTVTGIHCWVLNIDPLTCLWCFWLKAPWTAAQILITSHHSCFLPKGMWGKKTRSGLADLYAPTPERLLWKYALCLLSACQNPLT